MKTILRILTIGIFLISGQLVMAQTPATSTKYTEAEVTELVNKYNMNHSRDVRPDATLSAQFNNHFPNAYDIDWETAGGIYEVEFEISRTDYKAYYDADANLLMYSYEMKSSAIPAIVKNAADAKYIDFKMDRDVEKIIKGKNVYYKVKMERREVEIKAIFKSDGTFVEEYYD